jgi:GNAT superfamily N-acetyltransferase
MNDPYVIRAARDDELEEVARVLASAFEQHRPRGAGVDPSYKRAFARYFEELVDVRGRREDAQLFVAVDSGLIVGTGTLYPPGRGPHYARAVGAKPWPDDWASLRLLAVHPTHRRRGIGRALLDARVQRARDLGASFVALHTSEEFADARRLIRKGEWKRVPEFDHMPAPGVRAEAYVVALRAEAQMMRLAINP